MSNINRINRGLWLLVTQLFFKRKFGYVGKKAIVFKPMQLDNTKAIGISDNVFVCEGAWLMGAKDSNLITLQIGKGTAIGHYAHIIALSEVVIEDNVLIADRVFISDCTHEYKIIDRPVCKQDIRIIKNLRIGEGSWLGENVCVCGASIGKHCVIGANSVVIKDIPDYCVAVGAPAKIVKKYSIKTGKWTNIDS